MFCKETSKSIKNSKRKKMQEGFYSCNTPPYGYKKDPEEAGKLIVDKEAAKVVKKIFELKMEGFTHKKIAEYLNKKGVQTPARYLQIKGLSSDVDQIWTRPSVSKILCNKVYLGDCVRGKTQNISYNTKKRNHVKSKDFVIVKNTHEPIITREIFEEVHRNSKIYGMIKKTNKKIETKFGDYIYCHYCGKKIQKRNSRGKINLHCSNNRNSEELCKFAENYFYEQIEPLIINQIKETFEKYFRDNSIKLRVLKKYNSLKIEELISKSKEQDIEVRKATFKISKLYHDRLNGKISEEEYKKQYAQLLEDRKNANIQKEKADLELRKFRKKNDDINKTNKIKKIIKSLTSKDLTLEDIEQLIVKIELGKGSIYIHYKFEDIDEKKNPAMIEHHNH